eukprot:gnl/MRDRNA2_/MRDRNA2_304862_c0_seq1.p1 gnl/MRDRNA2_/MRDRNA2_304862_c0~~gnl/MRDRNA2_/MRDRNA2_304862_c0_seq1.p1  ORF type:complete len:133 (+),score=11.05 gnl/MRDRNA2_/MRDRNA2_304862_c0_seq1:56-400(+)
MSPWKTGYLAVPLHERMAVPLRKSVLRGRPGLLAIPRLASHSGDSPQSHVRVISGRHRQVVVNAAGDDDPDLEAKREFNRRLAQTLNYLFGIAAASFLLYEVYFGFQQFLSISS